MSLTDFKEKKEEDYETKKLKKMLRRHVKQTKEIGGNKHNINKKKFNPLLETPFFEITTKQNTQYSVWKKPTIYLPYNEEIQEVHPSFIFINSKTSSLYNLKNFEKELKAHKHLTKQVKLELTQKLIKKIKNPKLLLYFAKNLTQKELRKIIITSAYLQPEHTLIIIEDYLKPELKISMPSKIKFVENTGVNEKKAEEEIIKIL